MDRWADLFKERRLWNHSVGTGLLRNNDRDPSTTWSLSHSTCVTLLHWPISTMIGFYHKMSTFIHFFSLMHWLWTEAKSSSHCTVSTASTVSRLTTLYLRLRTVSRHIFIMFVLVLLFLQSCILLMGCFHAYVTNSSFDSYSNWHKGHWHPFICIQSCNITVFLVFSVETKLSVPTNKQLHTFTALIIPLKELKTSQIEGFHPCSETINGSGMLV